MMPAGPGAPRVTVTLVTGATAHARESAIAAQLPSPHQNGADPHGPEHGAAPTAVILEGLADAGSPLFPSASVLISRIAPGCLCCTGNLVLRVTLNRFLRQRPERLFIGVARSEHLDQLRSWLQSAPYDQLLELAPVLAS